MDYRAIAAAMLVATCAAAPASAQSVQDAQRKLFVCMQKASNLELKDDKKQEFIQKCVDDAEKAGKTDRDRS